MKEQANPLAPRFSEAFKRGVCEEYLAGGVSKMTLLRRYNIRYKSAIQHWLRQYGYEDIHVKGKCIPSQPVPAMKTDPNKEESATQKALKERIKQLERQLEDEQLRAQAYDLMIELAEKEFKIPIRKKSDTK